MANSVNQIYKFIFTKPIIFKRVYDFKRPDSFANHHWIPSDSDEIEVIEYPTKNTLVQKIVMIYHPQEEALNSYYRVSIRGANTTDVFKVAAYNINDFLEIFNIM